MLSFILMTATMVAVYWFWIRPILKSRPAFAECYACEESVFAAYCVASASLLLSAGATQPRQTDILRLRLAAVGPTRPSARCACSRKAWIKLARNEALLQSRPVRRTNERSESGSLRNESPSGQGGAQSGSSDRPSPRSTITAQLKPVEFQSLLGPNTGFAQVFINELSCVNFPVQPEKWLLCQDVCGS
jgi:hypothetical protein